MPRLALATATFVAASLPTPAVAALPEPVKAMIDAAIASGNKPDVLAVVKIAKATNPDDLAEINAIMSDYNARLAEQAKAALREKQEAGLFENWKGQGELGGFRSTGNTRNLGVSGGLKLVKDAVKWRLNFLARADYERNKGKTTRDQLSATIEPNYKFGKSLYAYGLAQFERDRLQGFSARYTLSGGLGYELVKTKDLRLAVKAGPAIRITDFAAGDSKSSLAALVGLDLDWKISDNLKFSQDTGGTYASDAQGFTSASAVIDSDNISFAATSAFDAKLLGALSARFSYTIEHETNPPVGRIKTDTLSRATLVYDF
jgi:putative salt-induced outer membrane protein